MLLFQQFDHQPTTLEITTLLEKLHRKPDKILTDNGNQFKLKWKQWCRDNAIESLFAYPYYPQDKGKVERTIRNVAEEFVNLLNKFPEWLKNIWRYRRWYNKNRFHRDINTQPANLYTNPI